MRRRPLERTEHPIRHGEPIEGDEERLAMRQGDMLPPVPERVANPRIREDRAVQDFQCNSEKMHRATCEDAYARAWFDYCRSVFPQSVRKAGPNVDLHNVSTYQRSILFNNMGSFSRKSEFRKAENMFKPFFPNEKFNVTNDPQLSLLWGNNYAHVILTAEADSLPTDEKELHDDYGLVGCHSSRSNDLSVHTTIDSSGYFRLLWESDDDRNGHAAIFEVKFGKTSQRAVKESRERSVEELFDILEPVAFAVEGSDLGTTEGPLSAYSKMHQ